MITDSLRAIKESFGECKPKLIAVSKQQPDEKIEEALGAGLRIFGENRVQEAQERWAARKAHYPDLELHLIGPLQTNKIKAAAELFDVIHTLDREKLAQSIQNHAPDMPCFIQVNTGAEDQKSGVLIGELPDFNSYCCADLKLNIIGLMCIPPVEEPAALHFGLLADWAHRCDVPNLSMGMSGDYETALHYGATHIRIGSKLFGERQT